MKSSKFWIPVVLSLIWTPLSLLFGIVSAGAGHSNYLMVKVLFPFTMLSTVAFGTITYPFVYLAVVQFPIYGLILGVANVRHAFSRWAMGMLLIHTLAATTCFFVVGPKFSGAQ